MITMPRRWAGSRADRTQEGGYVAVMTALLFVVLMGLAAFAVDVGHWYVVGQQEQRAADAAALAGVTSLPGNKNDAYQKARDFSKINGFENGMKETAVVAGLDGRPTRLRVTVSGKVKNIFGPLLGVDETTITRTAVADYAEPVPMGSPCNEFGNDPSPDRGSNRGATCADVSGQLWVNVNSPSSEKANGDSYQSVNGCGPGVDGCSGSTNDDYHPDGYFYTISVTAPMSELTIQLFDPAFVSTGLTCNTNFGSGTTGSPYATTALNDEITDETTRYASGTTGEYCTGDGLYGGTQVMNTQFTVREPGSNSWDPSSFPVYGTCQKTYPGFSGALFNVLDQYTTGTTPRSTYNATIVDGFRRWTTLCTIPQPAVGDYLIQVKTNGVGSDNANAGNRFAIRAYGAGSNDKESITVSGREKMGIFSNKPGATTEFHLARVPSGAAGQSLMVRLFDVGDADTSGTVKIVAPPGAAGGAFAACRGGVDSPITSLMSTCQFTVQRSTHNGKWQDVSVPIPSAYSCDDVNPKACWVRLQYINGARPTDVTTWTASIEGDPVRLVA